MEASSPMKIDPLSPDLLTINQARSLPPFLRDGAPVSRAAVQRWIAKGRSRWGPLLEAGADIYEYQPTMYHCKVMIIDDLWTSVGSTNFAGGMSAWTGCWPSSRTSAWSPKACARACR